MKTDNKKKGLIALIVVFAVVFVCTAGYIAVRRFGLFSADQTNKKVQESFAPKLTQEQGTTELLTIPKVEGSDGPAPYQTHPSTAPMTKAGDVPVEEVNRPVDFEGLMKYNPDVYAWIYIPDTNISLPVLQSPEDDNYYLEHDVYKDYSFPGAIYSQSMNSKDFSDRVTVLYGHNMLNGSMFANLHLFSDRDFFDSHPYVYIYTKDRRLVYQVICAHEYDDRHIMNSYDFSDNTVFSDWLQEAKNPHSLYSVVRDEVQLDLNSKILILSTCGAGDSRFLVQGVMISNEQAN